MDKIFNKIPLIIIALFCILSLIILKVFIPNVLGSYANLASFIVWVGVAISLILFKDNETVFKNNNDKIKTIIIIVTVAYLLYFLLGLFVGYNNSPFSKDIGKFITNILYFVGVVILQEFVRNKLLNLNTTKIGIGIITLFFIIAGLNFSAFSDKADLQTQIFNFITLSVIPVTVVNIVCTYLSTVGGLYLDYAYIVPLTLVQYILPIFPNLDELIVISFRIILAFVIIVYLNYTVKTKKDKLNLRDRKKTSPVKSLPVTALLILFVFFVGGFLPIKPLAVMSNSMVPEFARGDVVITQKIFDDFASIKVGDIIECRTTNGTVIHRVYSISQNSDGEYEFVTKGDANNAPDKVIMGEENVLGKVVAKVPYIGYPSVWIAEIIFKRDAVITLE